MSHLAALTKARDERWPAVLILEDDVLLDGNRFHARVWRTLAFLPEKWGMLYLSYNNIGVRGFACDAPEPAVRRPPCTVACLPLCRVRGHILDLAAYAVHASAYDEIIRWIQSRLRLPYVFPLDMELSLYIATHPSFAVYAPAPGPLITQSNRFGDSNNFETKH